MLWEKYLTGVFSIILNSTQKDVDPFTKLQSSLLPEALTSYSHTFLKPENNFCCFSFSLPPSKLHCMTPQWRTEPHFGGFFFSFKFFRGQTVRLEYQPRTIPSKKEECVFLRKYPTCYIPSEEQALKLNLVSPSLRTPELCGGGLHQSAGWCVQQLPLWSGTVSKRMTTQAVWTVTLCRTDSFPL